jgi:hypothetical protein
MPRDSRGVKPWGKFAQTERAEFCAAVDATQVPSGRLTDAVVLTMNTGRWPVLFYQDQAQE